MKADIVATPGQLKPLDSAKLDSVAKVAADLRDPRAAELLRLAVVAGKRGQRSYSEQLFSRAELLVGPKKLGTVAKVFRENAPPRVETPLKLVALDSTPQPKGAVGSSEEGEPAAPGKFAGPSWLTGRIVVDGKPLTGMGVIMLEPTTGKFKKRVPKKRVIEQREREFAPHVLAVPVGSTVSFPNFDDIYHNVFSLSTAAPFDLGLYKAGETREIFLAKEGVVRLGCNIHSAMAAFIIVVSAPHYVVADESGAFAFHRLLPGSYTMKTWTEHSAAPMVGEIEIKRGANDFTVTAKADATDHNPDKFGTERN
jgi:plastocyanin